MTLEIEQTDRSNRGLGLGFYKTPVHKAQSGRLLLWLWWVRVGLYFGEAKP